jgi:hypothetical protein
LIKYHCIFIFEAILGVDHDLFTLHHEGFIVLQYFRVYSTRVASYKKASDPHLSNHNSDLWIIIITCLIFLSLHHLVLMCTFGRMIYWMFFLVLVDV